jgi:hypothetical protein
MYAVFKISMQSVMQLLIQRQYLLCRNEYPLFDNFDLRELSRLFKDTEEDWAVWFDRIGDPESDEELPLEDDATTVKQITNCVITDLLLIVKFHFYERFCRLKVFHI